jgi:hypothetical protein
VIVGLRFACTEISELVEMLPWSLRSEAGAEEKPATPVGMTAQDNAKKKASVTDLVIGHYCLQESVSQRR